METGPHDPCPLLNALVKHHIYPIPPTYRNDPCPPQCCVSEDVGADLLLAEISGRITAALPDVTVQPPEPMAVRSVLQAADIGPAARAILTQPRPQGLGVTK